MAQHKAGCKFDGFYKSLVSRDRSGPDSILSIDLLWDEGDGFGITFDYNENTRDPDKDEFFKFDYCPGCGVYLYEEIAQDKTE